MMRARPEEIRAPASRRRPIEPLDSLEAGPRALGAEELAPAPSSRAPEIPEGRPSFARGADGTRLFVRTMPAPAGAPTEPSVLLCDGIACDGFIWKYLWGQLGELLPLVHWNYRGHGRSGSPADPARLSIEDLAEDCDAVRRHVGDPPVVIVGHSMGCQVALETYRRRPEGVRALVLLCGSSGRITHTFKGTNVLANVLPMLIDRISARPELARALWSRVPASATAKLALLLGEIDGKSVRTEDVLSYLRHMVDLDLPMYLRMLRMAGEHSADDLLPRIDVPVLVVAAERDTFTPPACAKAMAEAIPGAELEVLAGATHAAPMERADFVGERIARFLRERVLPA